MSVLMVSGCNQKSLKSKTERIFNSRSNNWKLVDRQYLACCCFGWFSATETNVRVLTFIICIPWVCSHARLQTFNFTIRTSSINSGFPLPPRFAATKLICTSGMRRALLWEVWKLESCSPSVVSTTATVRRVFAMRASLLAVHRKCDPDDVLEVHFIANSVFLLRFVGVCVLSDKLTSAIFRSVSMLACRFSWQAQHFVHLAISWQAQ